MTLPSDSLSVSQRLTRFVPCAGVGQRVVECPTPLALRDKSQSVREQCNKVPRLPPLISSGGIRTSGLEVLPKGALTVLPMQSGAVKGSSTGASKDTVALSPKRALEHWTGAVKGSTQGASQDSSCGASQESTGASQGSTHGALNAIWCRQRKHSKRFPR